MIALTRARLDPDTKAYLARRQAEGKSKREAIRCLKRHLARRFHRILTAPQPSSDGAFVPGVSGPDADVKPGRTWTIA